LASTRNVAVLTREYPPEVYGGAGTHVEYLVRELRKLLDVTVHCWGSPREEAGVKSYGAWEELAEPKPEAAALQAMSIDLAMAAGARGSDLAHSHTWYANLAGHLAKLMWSIPHVMTIHSLEPLRPWKAEQLGGGYALSLYCERTAIEAADAVIAVSAGVRKDVLEVYPAVEPGLVHVIHNGIDPDVYRRQPSAETLARHGVDAASSPDTPEIAAQVNELASKVRAGGRDLVWIDHFLPREELIHLHSGATVFVCPSIYEPFGLVILEAMACETAVVASRVGGIPEIVVEGETGFLVDYDSADTEIFTTELAARIDLLLGDEARAMAMGEAGRKRVVEKFGWAAIAATTARLYESLLSGPR
jgi:starch synthase